MSGSKTEAEQDQDLAAQIAALVSKDRQEKATELTDANKRLVKVSLVEAREILSTNQQSMGIEILDDVMSAVIDGKPQEALDADISNCHGRPNWGEPTRQPWRDLCNSAKIRQLQIDVDQSIRDDKYVIPTALPLRPSEFKLEDFTLLKKRDGTYSDLAPDAQVEEAEEASSESDSTAGLSEEKPPPPAVKPTSSSQPSSSDESDGDQLASIKNIPPGSSKKKPTAPSKAKKTASPTSKSKKTPPPTPKSK
ncbi:hypothetical protein PI124_g14277 [Phytophthora idaei]|nr:hypothetical protein PI124_g14277 [Phytophthora idaei]